MILKDKYGCVVFKKYDEDGTFFSLMAKYSGGSVKVATSRIETALNNGVDSKRWAVY